MTGIHPAVRPARPFFSSGPCAKRPGWTSEVLDTALIGRSHRSDPGKAKLKEIDVEGLNNLWPVSWYINGWTDYTIDSMLACKGPGE